METTSRPLGSVGGSRRPSGPLLAISVPGGVSSRAHRIAGKHGGGMAQEEQRRPAARTGTWGLGFGIALAALALVAGWYVPSPRAPATSTPTPSVVSGPTST